MTCRGEIVIWMREGVLTAECDDDMARDCGFKTELRDYWGQSVKRTDELPTLSGRSVIEIMDRHLKYAKEQEIP